MSRKILCPNCDKILSGLAKQYNELYESVEGNSKRYFMCDDCGVIIKENEKCFASCLLPDKSHFNYEHQKPESWMDDFITPIKYST